MRQRDLAVLGALLLSPLAASAFTQVSGSGVWRSRVAGGATHSWSVEIDRADSSSYSGTLHLVGSPFIDDAVLDGGIIGDEVSGALRDPNQSMQVVGTFRGKALAATPGSVGMQSFFGGIVGTYTFTNGDHGDWVAPNMNEIAVGCLGDCGGDQIVSADELNRLQYMVLDGAISDSEGDCRNADSNLSGAIEAHEILQSAARATKGCE